MSTTLNTLTSEPLTDLGNAKRFVERHGQDIRYCIQWDKWMVWDGKRWAIDTTGEIDRRAKETVRSMLEEASKTEDSGKRKELVTHAMKSEYEGHIRSLISLASTEAGIPVTPDELDRDPLLLNCENGTIDFQEKTCYPHCREDLITKLAPVNYDYTATRPLFDQFLARITGSDTELMAYIQRCIGYALTGDVSEKALFVLYGKGDNGKTTLLEAIRYVLGDYAGQLPIESLMAKRNDGIPNDIAQLKGLRFVTSSEAEQGRRLAESKVKQLTGMGTLQARFMYQEHFQFIPTFKLFLDSNHKPEVRGTDNAIWNRIKLIPFLISIPDEEKDRHLLDKLKAEAPGILAWAVRGCLLWRLDGLVEPKSVKAATNEYREEMDLFADFLEAEGTLDPGLEETAEDLYSRYKGWCTTQREWPISKKSFGTRLGDTAVLTQLRIPGQGERDSGVNVNSVPE
jgi:putative DNA primase/helicase